MEEKMPKHVAIICDGNGRWAKQRGFQRWKGHEEGFKNVKYISKYVFDKGIGYLSLYLFSTENFKRPKKEVNFIMDLLLSKLQDVFDFCHEEKIKAVVSGEEENLSPKINYALKQLQEETKSYQKTLNLCFNYGGKREIVQAAIKYARENNSLELTEDLFDKYLYQKMPPVDLLIRTSGEMRMSNFMLWQCAYAELYFDKTYFPDFKDKQFDKALLDYKNRDRRYGGIDDEETNN